MMTVGKGRGLAPSSARARSESANPRGRQFQTPASTNSFAATRVRAPSAGGREKKLSVSQTPPSGGATDEHVKRARSTLHAWQNSAKGYLDLGLKPLNAAAGTAKTRGEDVIRQDTASPQKRVAATARAVPAMKVRKSFYDLDSSEDEEVNFLTSDQFLTHDGKEMSEEMMVEAVTEFMLNLPNTTADGEKDTNFHKFAEMIGESQESILKLFSKEFIQNSHLQADMSKLVHSVNEITNQLLHLDDSDRIETGNQVAISCLSRSMDPIPMKSMSSQARSEEVANRMRNIRRMLLSLNWPNLHQEFRKWVRASAANDEKNREFLRQMEHPWGEEAAQDYYDDDEKEATLMDLSEHELRLTGQLRSFYTELSNVAEDFLHGSKAIEPEKVPAARFALKSKLDKALAQKAVTQERAMRKAQLKRVMSSKYTSGNSSDSSRQPGVQDTSEGEAQTPLSSTTPTFEADASRQRRGLSLLAKDLVPDASRAVKAAAAAEKEEVGDPDEFDINKYDDARYGHLKRIYMKHDDKIKELNSEIRKASAGLQEVHEDFKQKMESHAKTTKAQAEAALAIPESHTQSPEAVTPELQRRTLTGDNSISSKVVPDSNIAVLLKRKALYEQEKASLQQKVQDYMDSIDGEIAPNERGLQQDASQSSSGRKSQKLDKSKYLRMLSAELGKEEVLQAILSDGLAEAEAQDLLAKLEGRIATAAAMGETIEALIEVEQAEELVSHRQRATLKRTENLLHEDSEKKDQQKVREMWAELQELKKEVLALARHVNQKAALLKLEEEAVTVELQPSIRIDFLITPFHPQVDFLGKKAKELLDHPKAPVTCNHKDLKKMLSLALDGFQAEAQERASCIKTKTTFDHKEHNLDTLDNVQMLAPRVVACHTELLLALFPLPPDVTLPPYGDELRSALRPPRVIAELSPALNVDPKIPEPELLRPESVDEKDVPSSSQASRGSPLKEGRQSLQQESTQEPEALGAHAQEELEERSLAVVAGDAEASLGQEATLQTQHSESEGHKVLLERLDLGEKILLVHAQNLEIEAEIERLRQLVAEGKAAESQPLPAEGHRKEGSHSSESIAKAETQAADEKDTRMRFTGKDTENKNPEGEVFTANQHDASSMEPRDQKSVSVDVKTSRRGVKAAAHQPDPDKDLNAKIRSTERVRTVLVKRRQQKFVVLKKLVDQLGLMSTLGLNNQHIDPETEVERAARLGKELLEAQNNSKRMNKMEEFWNQRLEHRDKILQAEKAKMEQEFGASWETHLQNALTQKQTENAAPGSAPSRSHLPSSSSWSSDEETAQTKSSRPAATLQAGRVVEAMKDGLTGLLGSGNPAGSKPNNPKAFEMNKAQPGTALVEPLMKQNPRGFVGSKAIAAFAASAVRARAKAASREHFNKADLIHIEAGKQEIGQEGTDVKAQKTVHQDQDEQESSIKWLMDQLKREGHSFPAGLKAVQLLHRAAKLARKSKVTEEELPDHDIITFLGLSKDVPAVTHGSSQLPHEEQEDAAAAAMVDEWIRQAQKEASVDMSSPTISSDTSRSLISAEGANHEGETHDLGATVDGRTTLQGPGLVKGLTILLKSAKSRRQRKITSPRDDSESESWDARSAPKSLTQFLAEDDDENEEVTKSTAVEKQTGSSAQAVSKWIHRDSASKVVTAAAKFLKAKGKVKDSPADSKGDGTVERTNYRFKNETQAGDAFFPTDKERVKGKSFSRFPSQGANGRRSGNYRENARAMSSLLQDDSHSRSTSRAGSDSASTNTSRCSSRASNASRASRASRTASRQSNSASSSKFRRNQKSQAQVAKALRDFHKRRRRRKKVGKKSDTKYFRNVNFFIEAMGDNDDQMQEDILSQSQEARKDKLEDAKNELQRLKSGWKTKQDAAEQLFKAAMDKRSNGDQAQDKQVLRERSKSLEACDICKYEIPFNASGEQQLRIPPTDFFWKLLDMPGHKNQVLVDRVRRAILQVHGSYKECWTAMCVPGAGGIKMTRGSLLCGLNKLHRDVDLSITDDEAAHVFLLGTALPTLQSSFAAEMREEQFVSLMRAAEPIESMSEFRARVHMKHGDNFEEIFKSLDADHNDFLEAAEFAQLCFDVGGNGLCAQRLFLMMAENDTRPLNRLNSLQVSCHAFLFSLRQAAGLDEVQRLRSECRHQWSFALPEVFRMLPDCYQDAPVTSKTLAEAFEGLGMGTVDTRALWRLARREGGGKLVWVQDILLRCMAGIGSHFRELVWQLTAQGALKHRACFDAPPQAVTSGSESDPATPRRPIRPTKFSRTYPARQSQKMDLAVGKLPDEANSKLQEQAQRKKSAGHFIKTSQTTPHQSGSIATTSRNTSQAEPKIAVNLARPLPKTSEVNDVAGFSQSFMPSQAGTRVKEDGVQQSVAKTAGALFHLKSDRSHRAAEKSVEVEEEEKEKQAHTTPRLPKLQDKSDSLAQKEKELPDGAFAQRPGTCPALPKLMEAERATERPATTSKWSVRFASSSPWWGELDLPGTPRGASQGKQPSLRFAATMGPPVLDSSPEVSKERDRQLRAQQWAQVGAAIGVLQ
eukprot:TRINITY_DN33204_c0_g2_i1.p1 TRINITY_DN33204_c0_g2~~TRINITY_DN33204_c0_g2_i1.p1  ORF type:complete len:2537 (-),score=532.90 TRINITY_DN33204_c0_g2_i1:162-7772(-)